VATVVPAVKVGIASGPGVGTAVDVAGGTEPDGWALIDGTRLGAEDGDALGAAKRQPDVLKASRIGIQVGRCRRRPRTRPA